MLFREVVWLGDSKNVISAFPVVVKVNLGFQLHLLQRRKQPTKSRPMRSIARGVYELKEQDTSGWYRVVYTEVLK